MHYSVPYEYIKCQVDIRITRNVIEVFYSHMRVCSHPRIYGRPGQYVTIMDHMPPAHQKYLEWDGKRFISWAESVGPSTGVVIRSILSSHKVEQQGYKACMGVLKLADKYSNPKEEKESVKSAVDQYGFTRGAEYYGGKK